MAVFDQVPVVDFELSCGHEGREFKNYFGGGDCLILIELIYTGGRR